VTVDYTAPDWPERVRAALGGEGVDVAFDGVGGEIGRAAAGLVRAGGRFCPFGMASGRFAEVSEEDAARRGVTVVQGTRLGPGESVALSRAALEEAAAGRLRPTVGQIFPLERAADAHAAIESRATLGKTLLLTAQRT
jgi:NADPH2:quinone reductase